MFQQGMAWPAGMVLGLAILTMIPDDSEAGRRRDRRRGCCGGSYHGAVMHHGGNYGGGACCGVAQWGQPAYAQTAWQPVHNPCAVTQTGDPAYQHTTGYAPAGPIYEDNVPMRADGQPYDANQPNAAGQAPPPPVPAEAEFDQQQNAPRQTFQSAPEPAAADQD